MRATHLSRLVAGATLALTLGAALGPAATADSGPTLTSQQRNVIRDATKRYRDVDAAVAAGYVPAGDCASLPGVGGMGYHYLNPALASDDVIDPARPELLVYHRSSSGSLELGAVEYFKADADQNTATDDDRPSLFGTYPFDGPMPGHEPGMPIHFDLHVWLYDHNPSGELAPWNPQVSCP